MNRKQTGHAGSSPALAIACVVCEVPAGDYCIKDDGSPQIIAHKRRRQAAEKLLSAATPKTCSNCGGFVDDGVSETCGRDNE